MTGPRIVPFSRLEDRVGRSCHVVPSRLVGWLVGGDAAARDRAFVAMLDMGKLDVAGLERAFEGR